MPAKGTGSPGHRVMIHFSHKVATQSKPKSNSLRRYRIPAGAWFLVLQNKILNICKILLNPYDNHHNVGTFSHGQSYESRRDRGHLQKDGFKMFEILPQLHLSKFPTEIPTEITHILNMCGTPHPFDSTRTYLHIPLNDIDNITPHIEKIIHLIENALRGDGNILVHMIHFLLLWFPTSSSFDSLGSR